MKRKALLIPMILIMIVAGITITALISGNDSEKAEADKPYVLSMTASVQIPDEVTFAGESMTTERYDIRERLDRELNMFTYMHSSTMLLIKRANRMFPIIEPILKRNGIPDDMKYLAVIESSLDTDAKSPAGAIGLWQFMSSTAKEFGMEVTSEVDERYNIEKSTISACRFLKNAYAKYGSWSAASMSYNGGMSRITTALSNQEVEEATDLWLVQETTRYYYRMLAAKLIFENPRDYGFVLKANQLYKPIEFKEVKVSTSIPNLVTFAKQNGLTYAQLKDFNTWLRDDKLTNRNGKTYTILIPTEESLYYKKGEKFKIHNLNWASP
ncbi:MAG: lytic transglycosylase domain-containing protein [Dysgonamonadaceae bacterium]